MQRRRQGSREPNAAAAAAAASSSPCRGSIVAAVGGAFALAIVMAVMVVEMTRRRDSGSSGGIRTALRQQEMLLQRVGDRVGGGQGENATAFAATGRRRRLALEWPPKGAVANHSDPAYGNRTDSRNDEQHQQQQRRTRRNNEDGSDGKQEEQMPDEVREECDCFRHSDSPACCQRAVICDHKFGWQLTGRLFNPVPAQIDRVAINVGAFPSNPFQDYRHVAVVRNLSEALVSGYLYHKTGHECWLNYNGAERPWERVEDWDPFLNRTTHLYDLAPFPPRNGRSICRYVADEPEEVGMKVYVGVALEWWYGGINDYYRVAKERQVQGETQRTRFLCIEHYPDAASQERMFYEIMDWLVPGGHNFMVPPGVLNDDPDHGGHATSHNVTDRTRTRLLELVHRLDREVFRNAISATEAHFGCPGTVSRNR